MTLRAGLLALVLIVLTVLTGCGASDPAVRTLTRPGPAPKDTSCSRPVARSVAADYVWSGPAGAQVNADVWGPQGAWSQQLDVCSPASWNVVADFDEHGGAVQAYPDTQFVLDGRPVSGYRSLRTCFGSARPDAHGGHDRWSYGYDVWFDDWRTEIMVWNDWSATGLYPPADARAVTIDGVAYHTWKGGGANEWIYTRDDHARTGCFDMMGVVDDLLAHPGSSGLTAASALQAVEYGVEIASTNGPETFQVHGVSLAVR